MDANKIKTLDFLDGIWGFKNDLVALRLEILPNKVTMEYEDEKSEFANHARWQDDTGVLMFTNTPFYVREAGEKYLVFGKRSAGSTVGIDWEYRLERIGATPEILKEHNACHNVEENLHDHDLRQQF